MKYIEKLKLITYNLEKCDTVTKHSTIEENQVDTFATALIDIEECLQNMGEQIPKLYSKDLMEKEIDDLIFEIGEQLRHLLYHVNDTKVYDYLKPI